MAFLMNGPTSESVLRLHARKSYALGIVVRDRNNEPIDLTGCTLRLVVRGLRDRSTTDDTNLITNDVAELTMPVQGLARFNLQALDLDHKPGEYRFSVTLISQGYSLVLAAGTLDLLDNTEFSSVNEVYSAGGQYSASLRAQIGDNATVTVTTGPAITPGQAVFTRQMQEMIKSLYSQAVAQGKTLTADDIADGQSRFLLTLQDRERLNNLSLDWADIQGKPSFGSAALRNSDEFLAPQSVRAQDIVSGILNAARLPMVAEHRGISWGTAAPGNLVEGEIYFQYE